MEKTSVRSLMCDVFWSFSFSAQCSSTVLYMRWPGEVAALFMVHLGGELGGNG